MQRIRAAMAAAGYGERETHLCLSIRNNIKFREDKRRKQPTATAEVSGDGDGGESSDAEDEDAAAT